MDAPVDAAIFEDHLIVADVGDPDGLLHQFRVDGERATRIFQPGVKTAKTSSGQRRPFNPAPSDRNAYQISD